MKTGKQILSGKKFCGVYGCGRIAGKSGKCTLHSQKRGKK